MYWHHVVYAYIISSSLMKTKGGELRNLENNSPSLSTQ